MSTERAAVLVPGPVAESRSDPHRDREQSRTDPVVRRFNGERSVQPTDPEPEEIIGKGWAKGNVFKRKKGKAVSQSNAFANEGAGHHRPGDFCSLVVQELRGWRLKAHVVSYQITFRLTKRNQNDQI